MVFNVFHRTRNGGHALRRVCLPGELTGGKLLTLNLQASAGTASRQCAE
jgi:hypothetical protein